VTAVKGKRARSLSAKGERQSSRKKSRRRPAAYLRQREVCAYCSEFQDASNLQRHVDGCALSPERDKREMMVCPVSAATVSISRSDNFANHMKTHQVAVDKITFFNADAPDMLLAWVPTGHGARCHVTARFEPGSFRKAAELRSAVVAVRLLVRLIVL